MAFNKAKALQEAERSVAQGKIPQAIKQYLAIVEKDPADLTLLNTVGDLYVRDKNLPEGLRHFHKLADSYVQEGFTVKAIAIYKKISKLAPNNVDPLLKLGELYHLQGLGREARDQYLQAVEFYRKKNQSEQAVNVLQKIVQLDPENVTVRSRLAQLCEQLGKNDIAAQVHLQAAELALRRGEVEAAEPALKKAVELDPKNLQARILLARTALLRNHAEEAEKILTSAPELQAHPTGKQLLLEAYLAQQKAAQAENLVVEVFKANPADFGPVANYSSLCLEKGDVEAAFHPLAELADSLIEQKNTAPLVECLRRVWNKAPQHLPNLELLLKVSERTADEATIPEVLEALAHVYVQAEQLPKAEESYRALIKREPENEHYKDLLRQVLQKQGKDVGPPKVEELEKEGVALAPEGETAAAPVVDSEQAALVKEALENSDLFTRYNLPEKAVAELEKVLAVYPDQIEIHKRILEICRKNLPERATQAAQALSRIYAERGETARAERYEQAAQAPETALIEEPAPAEAGMAEAPAIPGTPETKEFDLSAEFSFGATAAPAEAAVPEAAAPAEAPFDLSQPAAPAEATFDLSPPPAPVEEAAAPPAPEPAAVDLTGELDLHVAPPPEAAPAPATPAEVRAFNFDESRVELEFYLDNGFIDEARAAVTQLAEKFPGEARVTELRQYVEARARGEAVPAPVEAPSAPVAAAPLAAPFEAPREPAAAAPAEPTEIEIELPTSFEVPEIPPAPEPAAMETVVVPRAPEPLPPPPEPAIPQPPSPPPAAVEAAMAPPVPEPLPPPPAPSVLQPPSPSPAAISEPAPAAGLGTDMLGDLVGDLASTLDGLAEPEPPPAAAVAAGAQPAGVPLAAGVSPLSGLLEEMGEPAGAAAQDDPETHYNLGVAFREMSLLDEAIGEFQKVVKGAGKGKYPPNFLQACSLLAVCFMDKRMPTVAAKWYQRALETPDLDDEATMALQYDLGTAYELAGDVRTALEKYTEVYSQNIDYRDVAEKIRVLQQKVS